MMEPGVMWLMEKGKSRFHATLMWAVAAWIVGLGTVFSFNIWSNWYPFGFIPSFSQANFFQAIDHFINDYLLPINGIAFSLFAGWVIQRHLSFSGLSFHNPLVAAFWLWSVRITVPIALTIIVVGTFG